MTGSLINNGYRCRTIVLLSLVIILLSTRAQGQGEIINLIPSPFVAVVEKVLPSVVNISAERKTKIARPSMPNFGWPFDELFRDFSFPEQRSHSLGSGVIISEDGYIVTNNHLISGYDNIIVKLNDGTEFKGDDVKVIGADPQTDIAVIKINPSRKLTSIKYANPENIKIGDWAIAIGNPYGLQGTVTVGVISAIGRSGIPIPEGPARQDFIQTDAAINPGNSGGPLVNINGELIGINTAISSPVGANIGIGFAIPVSFVKSVAVQIISQGRVIRSYLGVRIQVIDEKLKKALKLTEANGVIINEVLPNTPAERAGLNEGDVIVELNGLPVKSIDEFRNRVTEIKPGAEITLKINRAGRFLTKKAILTEFPGESKAELPQKGKGKIHWAGIEVSELSSEEKRHLNLKSGVRVMSVDENSPASEAGILTEDIILKVGEIPINNKIEFYAELEKCSQRKEPAIFYIKRGDSLLFVAIEPPLDD